VRTAAQPPNSIALLDSAFDLLRAAPPSAWLVWAVGSLPFGLGVIGFVSEMTSSANAAELLLAHSLVLALLFLWMVASQALFARRLWPLLSGGARSRPALAAQAAIGSTALLMLPLSALSIVGFPWTATFYYSATASEEADVSKIFRYASRQASTWSFSSVLDLAIASLLGLVVFVNVLVLLIAGPIVFRTITGEETVFTTNTNGLFNSTLFTAAVVITWLVMDPLMRAVYVIRCFRVDAIRTGVDLRATLTRCARVAMVLALLVIPSGAGLTRGEAAVVLTSVVPAGRPCPAIRPALIFAPGRADKVVIRLSPVVKPARGSQPRLDASNTPANAELRVRPTMRPSGTPGTGGAESPAQATGLPHGPESSSLSVEPQRLDRSIREVTRRPEFLWQEPRQVEAAPPSNAFLRFTQDAIRFIGDIVHRTLDWVGGVIRAIVRWLMGNQRDESPDGSGGRDVPFAAPVLYALMALAAGAAIALLLRLRIQRRRKAQAAPTTPAAAAPDLASEDVSPDQAPEDAWLAMAARLLEAGDLRLATRALYLAVLASLGDSGLITIHRASSNLDYQRELARRARGNAGMLETFRGLVAAFERTWYGEHAMSRDAYNRFQAGALEMRARGQV
jgi:hypothetical protein